MHVVVLPVGPDIECSRGRLAAVASHSCVLDKLKNLDWQPKHGNHSALIGGTLDICASMTTIGLSEKRVVMHLTGAAQAGGGHPCDPLWKRWLLHMGGTRSARGALRCALGRNCNPCGALADS